MARPYKSQQLRVAELSEILGLYKEYRKQGIGVMECYERIGEETGREPSTVGAAIRRLVPTTDAAEAYIKSQALRLAVRLVRDASTPEILDVLSRKNVGVLAPKQEAIGGQGGFFLSVSAETCGAVKIGVMNGQDMQRQLGPGVSQEVPAASIVDADVAGEGADPIQEGESGAEEAVAHVRAPQGSIRPLGHRSPRQEETIAAANKRIAAAKRRSIGQAREVRMSNLRERKALAELAGDEV